MTAKRANKKPGKGRGKKVAAPLRQSGGKPLLRARQEAGQLEVSTLLRDLGTMIETARKQVAVY